METAIAVTLLLCLLGGAAAHGGKLHEYPGTPSGSNYLRTKVATCNKWVPADGPVKYSLVNSAAPGAATSDSNKPIVEGDVTVWQYLYNNCSLTDETPLPSAGVEFNVTFSSGSSKPLPNITLDGVAMTGSCASGGGSPFFFDPEADPVDDADNLLWFHNFTLPKSGVVHGNGANDGAVLTSGPAGRAIKSVMLVNAKTGAALSCCDLTLAGPPTTDWADTLTGKGVNCSSEEEPAAAAHASHADDDDHAGHDHGNMTDHADHDHDHDHDHNGTAAAKSGAAGTGASAAVMTAAAVFAAAVVALL